MPGASYTYHGTERRHWSRLIPCLALTPTATRTLALALNHVLNPGPILKPRPNPDEATLVETPSAKGAERLAAHMRAQQAGAAPANLQEHASVKRYAVRRLDMARAFDL